MAQSVYAVATMDTKGHELAFVAECLRAAGVAVTMVDVGVQGRPASCPTSIARRWPVFIPPPWDATWRCARRPVAGDHRDEPGARTVPAARARLGRCSGVIGIGGSGGTALITPAMGRADRFAEGHGFDGRQREHSALRWLERHHAHVFGRRRLRAQLGLTAGAGQRGGRDRGHGSIPGAAVRR